MSFFSHFAWNITVHWIPGTATVLAPPDPSCTNSKGCRCTIVHIQKGTPGAAEVVRLIRKLGGIATQAQIDQYDRAKEQRAEKKQKDHDRASDIFSEAHKLEKTDPEKAVELYHNSINKHIALAKKSKDHWAWRDFAYMYNRLTLVLERLGKYKEALDEIAKSEELPHQDMVSKTDRAKLEKRKARIIKKNS